MAKVDLGFILLLVLVGFVLLSELVHEVRASEKQSLGLGKIIGASVPRLPVQTIVVGSLHIREDRLAHLRRCATSIKVMPRFRSILGSMHSFKDQ